MIDRMICSNGVINGRAYMVMESIQIVGEISDQRPGEMIDIELGGCRT
jgi:hypothetical protein